jgi:hypothetical protein
MSRNEASTGEQRDKIWHEIKGFGLVSTGFASVHTYMTDHCDAH